MNGTIRPTSSALDSCQCVGNAGRIAQVDTRLRQAGLGDVDVCVDERRGDESADKVDHVVGSIGVRARVRVVAQPRDPVVDNQQRSGRRLLRRVHRSPVVERPHGVRRKKVTWFPSVSRQANSRVPKSVLVTPPRTGRGTSAVCGTGS